MKTKLLLNFFILIAIKFSAQLNCYQQSNGLYQYYAKIENIPNINSNFDKTDFINYVTTYGNLNSGNLATLNSDILFVSKSFPTSQTAFLQNVVNIDSNSDIYPIISNANNSISTIECRSNPILLKVQNFQLNNRLSVTKNPVDETSKLIIDSKIKNFKLTVTNSAGQIVYSNEFKNNENISLNTFIKETGLYILTIIDLQNKNNYIVKVIK
ncbi:T9SS type A sorting domain-containing protein [Chryseobacterium terrae]|uniref:T9SS type A sorting domain-containing protein n=1 Tax=Chryseobacterium terrae TaxID=3163299 RepID=A0ABW8Y239_9FLAO